MITPSEAVLLYRTVRKLICDRLSEEVKLESLHGSNKTAMQLQNLRRKLMGSPRI